MNSRIRAGSPRHVAVPGMHGVPPGGHERRLAHPTHIRIATARENVMESGTAPAKEDAAVKGTRRLLPEEREQQIVDKAIEHFTRNGFGGSTRDLARQIGVTQPLLYRYFESKEALIERVYNEVFQWRPDWDRQITDRSMPLTERLHAFYLDYSSVILREECYGLKVPTDMEAAIRQKVDMFLHGAPAAIRALRASAR